MIAKLKMPAVSILMVVFVTASPTNSEDSSQARVLAREAYHQVEGNVFRRAELQEAAEKIQQAYALDDREPYVYLAAALFTCVSGYKSHDWYNLENFQPGTIEKAAELAESAVEIDPDLGLGRATLGRFYIVQGRFEDAVVQLQRARELDSSSFYPHYFMGILHENLGSLGEANKYFETALQFVTHDYQAVITKTHQKNLARMSGNLAQQEQLLSQMIEDEPDRAQHYGNYASFLKIHGRYDEAIEYYERAIAISPYGAAVQGLEHARQLISQRREPD